MIQLGATVLNPNMLWPDRDSYSNVVQQRARTLGGTQVVWSQPSYAGRPITLEAVEDQGWLTKEQKDAVVAMADVPGGVYTLVVGAVSYSVMFNQTEGSPVEFSPLINRAVDLIGDYFIGQIRLFTL
jgi:hypothetical protein